MMAWLENLTDEELEYVAGGTPEDENQAATQILECIWPYVNTKYLQQHGESSKQAHTRLLNVIYTYLVMGFSRDLTFNTVLKSILKKYRH